MCNILIYKPTCKKSSLKKETDWRQDAVTTFKEGLSYFCWIWDFFPTPGEFKHLMSYFAHLFSDCDGCDTKGWVSEETSVRKRSGRSSFPCHHSCSSTHIHQSLGDCQGLEGLQGQVQQGLPALPCSGRCAPCWVLGEDSSCVGQGLEGSVPTTECQEGVCPREVRDSTQESEIRKRTLRKMGQS